MSAPAPAKTIPCIGCGLHLPVVGDVDPLACPACMARYEALGRKDQARARRFETGPGMCGYCGAEIWGDLRHHEDGCSFKAATPLVVAKRVLKK